MDSTLLRCLFLPVYILSILSGPNALARPQNVVLPPSQRVLEDSSQETASDEILINVDQSPLDTPLSVSSTLEDLLYALDVMQDDYFELWQGTWPTSIDWTAAVLGTHVSATLASLTAASDEILSSTRFGGSDAAEELNDRMARTSLAFENLINHFFDQIVTFYFGENAFSLRNQAYDDMLWVVLGWLENIKFQELHWGLDSADFFEPNATAGRRWHGTQFRVPAAHRARVFYDLASQGWDLSLCEGGMVWSPYLTPYKNAITNELFISASIGMYLYFPGDPIDSPFMGASTLRTSWDYPHDPAHLEAAVEGYRWLKQSNMTGLGDLYADGFHISGWRSNSQPGSRKCDVLNTMVYTYNQGVILSGLRGLWLATADQDYLLDGHELVQKVMRATGWPNLSSRSWAGLGRGGILEEVCDSRGSCSQNGQTFKGIFFHHLAEFCRPLRPQEELFLAEEHGQQSSGLKKEGDWRYTFQWHQARCRLYRPWIEHNAKAALMTRDDHGKFGTWWGRKYRVFEPDIADSSSLPPGAIDYSNYMERAEGSEHLVGALRNRTPVAAASSEFDGLQELEEEPTARRKDVATPPNTVTPDTANTKPNDYNDRGRGRTVETQSGGVAVLRALFQWKTSASLS